MFSKKLIFKIIIAVYIGLSFFRLTDPTLRWTNKANQGLLNYAPTGSPTDIKIIKLGLDLAISPSIVHGNDWQLFDDRVAWLTTSSIPGHGNTILYAHDRIGLFGDLYKLQIGDEINIYNGSWLKYRVSAVHTITPTDINAILSSDNRLTLYTCEGSFDQKRLVVYAK